MHDTIKAFFHVKRQNPLSFCPKENRMPVHETKNSDDLLLMGQIMEKYALSKHAFCFFTIVGKGKPLHHQLN